jgi:hypothetical protein
MIDPSLPAAHTLASRSVFPYGGRAASIPYTAVHPLWNNEQDRTTAIATARARLGDERIVSFLNALHEREHQVNAERPPTIAVDFAHLHLSSGRTLDELFLPLQVADPHTKAFGFGLQVRELGKGSFEIVFGCMAGSTTGDGGIWQVDYGADGKVQRIERSGSLQPGGPAG